MGTTGFSMKLLAALVGVLVFLSTAHAQLKNEYLYGRVAMFHRDLSVCLATSLDGLRFLSHFIRVIGSIPSRLAMALWERRRSFRPIKLFRQCLGRRKRIIGKEFYYSWHIAGWRGGFIFLPVKDCTLMDPQFLRCFSLKKT